MPTDTQLTKRPDNEPFQVLIGRSKPEQEERQRNLDQAYTKHYDNGVVEHVLAEDLEISRLDVVGIEADSMV